MISPWKGIDPREAEASLRGLLRRLSELDTALRHQQEILQERPDSFAFRLACDSLLRMQGNLQREMNTLVKYRVHETVDIALNGGPFADQAASIAALGTVLIRLQKLFNSIGQAIRTGPTLRGPVSNEIRQLTEFRVVAFHPSSFGMTLVSPAGYDLIGESLSAASLGIMFQLLRAAEDDDEIMRLFGELGGRAFGHFRHVIEILDDRQSTITMRWADYTGTQYAWEAGAPKVSHISARLRTMTERRSEDRVLQGRLVGASLLRNRFELLLADQTVIEGKMVSGVTEAVKEAFGKPCEAHVTETEIHDQMTGQSRSYYALTAVRPA